jgi:hypothetical protein
VVRTRVTKLSNEVLKDSEIAKNYLHLLNEKVLDCIWDSLIKRDVLIDNEVYFDERYKAGGEDIDFITRLLRYIKVFSLMDKCYYMHYIRAGFSTSSKFNSVKLDTVKLLADNITNGATGLGIDLYKNKREYVYQMTFTLLNGTASLLANENCKMSRAEKCENLNSLRKENFLPKWFFKQSSTLIIKISKRYALAYFLYKHKLYLVMLLMAKLRNRQLLIKSKLS